MIIIIAVTDVLDIYPRIPMVSRLKDGIFQRHKIAEIRFDLSAGFNTGEIIACNEITTFSIIDIDNLIISSKSVITSSLQYNVENRVHSSIRKFNIVVHSNFDDGTGHSSRSNRDQ